MKIKKVEFYTINAKVLPVVHHAEQNYVRLIKNWFQKGFKIQTKGDARHYYSLRSLSEIRSSKDIYYYGVLTKYVSFDDITFFDSETGKLLEHPIPKNVEGRVNEYEF